MVLRVCEKYKKYPKLDNMCQCYVDFQAQCMPQMTQTQTETVLGHYRPTSETPFKWRFAGGPIVVRFYMLTGSLLSPEW